MLNLSSPILYLVIYIIFLYVRPQEYPGVQIDAPVMPIALAIGFIAAIFQKTTENDPKQWIYLLGLMITVPLSVAANGWLGGAAQAFAKIIPALLLAYIASRSISTISNFRTIAIAISSLAAFISVYGIDQSSNGTGWTGTTLLQERIRYIGILADPNDIANVLLFSLPISIYLVLARESSFIIRAIASITVITTLWAIALTQSRGAIVALALMSICYLSLKLRNWKVLFIAPIFFIIIKLLLPDRFSDDDESGAEMSSAGRIFAWHHGLQLFLWKPLFGIGYGNFLNYHHRTAHNSFVLAFSELGFLGYLFWFSIIFMSFVMMYKIIIKKQEQTFNEQSSTQLSDIQAAATALFFGLVGLVTSSFFLSRTYMPVLYLATGMSAGLFALALKSQINIEPLKNINFFKHSLLVSVGSIALIYLAVRVGTLRYAS